ncbi:hypothetical protein [Oceanobacillus alkalisoli]|uniref:hypothetical protein n=1 Tax=Oceanobacillus alkalisoli TaxID=2925113 RepID=UPI001F11997E|nr:hypothetical protein [Oceanobacillus alkalisoli]MCF3942187.1 hypothetical protein [Oceanobacillus alkalisoli]
MIFDKQQFKKNAPSNIKRSIPQSHLDVLDGMEVTFKDSDKFGWIEHYEVPPNERGITNFYLYPVDKEWCNNQGQMNLF